SELRKHLEEQMTRSTPYSLADWGTILRALQLVDTPSGEILPKLFALYESQVLAFYDPHSHTYYSIRQLPELPPDAAKLVDPKTLEETVMVHELTHALQDQLFSLAKREKSLMRDTDANMAYHAVLEGEAVLVMVAHMLQKSGIDLAEVVKDDAMLETISSAAMSEQMIDPSTPRYFGEMLKFPYLEGLKLVIAAYRRGGWKAVDGLHTHPPRSTREVLHPDEYFARVASGKNAMPAFDASKPADALAAEHLGEFHWRFLVGEENARGLVSDRAIIWKDGRVAIETTWDDAKRAESFAAAYAKFLESRGLGSATLTRDGATVKATYKAP
ncbi:MAG TPA: hypothetical protein VFO89_01260, partial [Thermoanaerobaculia bacterium]|nr:hypothetical protein [Thermoanaerobaculia bacterium]